MTTFIEASKLLYYYNDNRPYWSNVYSTLATEFYTVNPTAGTADYDNHINATYGIELYSEQKDKRVIVFDSAQSKLFLSLRFPGL